MENMKYAYGPVPSRRLGMSLGISPIPEKACNYSCTYCQLGRTNHMSNQRQEFFPLEDILEEFRTYIRDEVPFDVVTVVGEGEPTLYSRLGELIQGMKAETDKPIAVITNGALLYDPKVREELAWADIVLPSMDAFDEASYKAIDRPYGKLRYDQVMAGLELFSHAYRGQIWMEVMLIEGANNDEESLQKFARQLERIRHDRVYVNTPVRPPAESYVQVANEESIRRAVELFGGISIDMLASGSFFSEIADPYEAILSIARRHPMNQFEVTSFLDSRKVADKDAIFARLEADSRVTAIPYKGIVTYRVN